MSNPFHLSGEWLKGNLHTHTTQSDGGISPARNIRWHEQNGYDFVSITDHNRVTIPQDYCETSLITILGAELSLRKTRGGGPFDVVACGLPPTFHAPRGNTLKPQEGLDLIRECGGLSIVAHPHWSVMTMEELAELSGFIGIEVYNTGCDYENRTGYAEPYWDDLLRRQRHVWGFGADDSHWRDPDYGGGWIMVKASERSEHAVIAALRDGHFYASCGPSIEDVSLDGRTLSVKCSPSRAIFWTEGQRGGSVHAPHGTTMRSAEFTIDARIYVRVQVVDEQGRWAWSHPLFVP